MRVSKKIVRLLIAVALLLVVLAACDLSTNTAPTDEPLGQDALNTIVAQTVEASVNQDAAMGTMVAQTVAAAEGQDQGDPPDDDDNPPANSEAPPTDEPTATQEPTATATEEPTATQEPTNTPPAGDPRNSLGKPDWEAGFDAKTDWYLYSDNDSETKIKDSKLVYTTFKKLEYALWSYGKVYLEDYYFETVITMPNNCAGSDRAGFILGTPKDSYTEGYTYYITCDGRFRFGYWDGATYTPLLGWESPDAINDGPDSENRLGVWWKGKQIKLYVNGELVGEITDDSITGKGKVGFLIGPYENDTFTVIFDDSAYWQLK